MVDSVRSNSADLVTYDLVVDGMSRPEILVRRIEVDCAVNKLPRAFVTCEDGDASEATFALSSAETLAPGQKVSLRLGYHSKNVSVFEGIIIGQTLRRAPGGDTELVVICADKAERLAQRRQNHTFFDSTDGEVIEAIAASAGLSATVVGASHSAPSQILNAASDWDFILARAVANGLVVSVQDGKLDVAPPGHDKSARLGAEFGDTISALDLTLDISTQLAGTTAHSWDPKTQEPVTAEGAASGGSQLGKQKGAALAAEIGDPRSNLYAMTPLAEDVLKTWASAALLRSRLALYRGSVEFSGTADLRAGDLLDLAGLGARFNGSGFIGRLVHDFEGGDWRTTAHIGLDPDWLSSAQGSGQMSAPLANDLRPGVRGLRLAKVLKTFEDPEGQHRIQVRDPLNDTSGTGIWVRIAAPYATAQAGCVFLPEVGDEVVIGYLDGDPDAGVMLGALHSEPLPAPLTPDEGNTTKTLTSRSGTLITFRDEPISLTLKTPSGHTITLDDEGKAMTLEDASGNSVTLSEEGLSLSSPKDISLKATGSVSVQGGTGVTVSSDADVSVTGANTTIKGDMQATLDGGGSVSVSGGAQAKIEATLVTIN